MSKEVRRNFDKVAANWDEKPHRRMVAEAVTAGIIASIPLHGELQVLEYGCGTGLCGLRLASEIGHLTAVDTSAGMLEELRKKCLALGIGNVTPVQISPDDWTLPAAAFDLVFSSMVMHHVEDVQTLLLNFYYILKPGGCLALSDLEQEDGTFHDDPTGVVHFGFDSQALATELEQLGFRALKSQTVHTIHKQHGNQEHTYPVFLITGQKPG
jgi:tRNA (cmo5U34)-methyltransferase